MKTILVLSMLLFIAGCITTRSERQLNYDHMMQGWVGKSKDHLIEKWGIPSKTMDLDGGKKVFAYYESAGTISDTSGAPAIGYATLSRDKSCTTTFFIDQTGSIEKYLFEGNYCQ